MIDPNDLRAGNRVIRIIGIDSRGKNFLEYSVISGDECCTNVAASSYPIPLTPAILGMCGLKHEFGDWYINLRTEGIDDGLPLVRYMQSEKCWYLWGKKIPAQPVYLHQLQNFYYALSAEELKISLGKFTNIGVQGPVTYFSQPAGMYQPNVVISPGSQTTVYDAYPIIL